MCINKIMSPTNNIISYSLWFKILKNITWTLVTISKQICFSKTLDNTYSIYTSCVCSLCSAVNMCNNVFHKIINFFRDSLALENIIKALLMLKYLNKYLLLYVGIILLNIYQSLYYINN